VNADRIARPDAAAAGVLAFCVSMAVVAADYATDTIEQIVVTAQKRPESLQDVPIAITAF
jgi:outer membrane receptor protein involved in Fe transport